MRGHAHGVRRGRARGEQGMSMGRGGEEQGVSRDRSPVAAVPPTVSATVGGAAVAPVAPPVVLLGVHLAATTARAHKTEL